MVLMSQRRAEQRHDAVAQHLIHRALVVMDRVHHVLDHRVEEPAGPPRDPGWSGARARSEIGEEDRDLLALPFDRRARGENSLGQVARSVCDGRCQGAGRASRRPQARPAFDAEPRRS